MISVDYIANTCPSEGKFAKYIAMSINASYGQDLKIADKLGCDTRTRNTPNTKSTSQDIKIFPNPSNGEFNIELSSNSNIQIKDRLGNIVFNEALQKGSYKISLDNYPSGIYFLQSISESGVKTAEKLLKI